MQKRLWPAVFGGLAFALVTIIFGSITGEDPAYGQAIVGGVVFTLAWLTIGAWLERRS